MLNLLSKIWPIWNPKNPVENLEMNNLYLFNSLTHKKELFKPINPDAEVGMYTCGPTVYNFPHLGNLRTYVFEDVLKRILSYDGYRVKHVMNITDVGHLTGDQDMGEDKLEREAKKEGKDAWAVAKFYTDAFFTDAKNLNIITPNVVCKATEHIAEQIELLKVLEKKGFTYKTSDGIYFDTSKVADYGKLSGQKLSDLMEGARIEKNDDKKNPTDFALWKFSPTNEKRQMEWPSPWGVGFPGWHIECSAMSMKYLGDHFDIHCGGVDHLTIHHTNEIAQTESATGKKPWVNYWIHGAFLNIAGGKKMAKSSGDFITVTNTFIDKGMSPLIYRYACLAVHYRKPMEWSDGSIESAKNGYANLLNKISTLGDKIGNIDETLQQKFLLAINDDMNMALALSIVQEVLKAKISNEDKLATILDFDKVLGLELNKSIKKAGSEDVPDHVSKLVIQRQNARDSKNWAESDRLRDEIKKHGYEVKDTSNGPEVKKI
ncbi:MAG: cysteine--tRNA ligase [bacterium]